MNNYTFPFLLSTMFNKRKCCNRNSFRLQDFNIFWDRISQKYIYQKYLSARVCVYVSLCHHCTLKKYIMFSYKQNLTKISVCVLAITSRYSLNSEKLYVKEHFNRNVCLIFRIFRCSIHQVHQGLVQRRTSHLAKSAFLKIRM